MQEIFVDISNEIKDIAQFVWNRTLTIKDPIDAADFLNTVVEYCKIKYSEKEAEFIKFYIEMKLMEMIKE